MPERLQEHRLEIVTREMPHEKSHVLNTPSKEVTFPLSDAMRTLIDNMKYELIAHDAAGFAAPQFGEHWRIIVYHVTELALKVREDARHVVPVTVLINPTYEAIESSGTTYDWEFCFSVMSEGGKVYRPTSIRLKAYDDEGRLVERDVHGFEARLLQHEIDHVHGLLCSRLYEAGGFHGPREEMMAVRKKEIEEKQRKAC